MTHSSPSEPGNSDSSDKPLPPPARIRPERNGAEPPTTQSALATEVDLDAEWQAAADPELDLDADQEDNSSDLDFQIQTLLQESEAIPTETRPPRSLSSQVTFWAIALGALSSLGAGAIAQVLLHQVATYQVRQAQMQVTKQVADRAAQTMQTQITALMTLARSPVLTNPRLRAATTLSDRRAILESVRQAQGFQQVTLSDRQGTVLAEVWAGDAARLPVTAKAIQQSLTTGKLYIHVPQLRQAGAGLLTIAMPLRDQSGQVITGVLWAAGPITLPQSSQASGAEPDYWLSDRQGQILASSQVNQVGKPLVQVVPALASTHENGGLVRQGGRDRWLSTTPVALPETLPNLNWAMTTATDAAALVQPWRQLQIQLALGISLMTLLTAAIATVLAQRLTQPIRALVKSAARLSAGDLEAHLPTQTSIDLTQIATTLNQLADQLRTSRAARDRNLIRMQQLGQIASQYRQSPNAETTLKMAVQEAQAALGADRAVVYQLDGHNGTVIVEMIAAGIAPMLGAKLLQADLLANSADRYWAGGMRLVPNVAQASDLSSSHRQILQQFQVQAEVLAPILVGDRLFGLLAAQQCGEIHPWPRDSLNFLGQIALHTGIALEQVDLKAQLATARSLAETSQQEQHQ